MENNKSYYAIIPANVRYDKDLTPNAKLLYGEITALCNETGRCWASNRYFAELYSVSNVSISKWISSLIEKGYISSEIEYKNGTKEILNRYLSLVNEPIKEKFNSPIKEKFKDNNTVINNTINKGVSENKFSLPNSPLLENFKLILKDFQGCSKITIQLTAENAETLFKEYTQEQIIEGLEIIENSNKALKNKSLYLTLRKILKNNFGGGAEFQKRHSDFKEVYKKWYEKLTGFPPKFSRNSNEASIELFKHLIDASGAKTEEAAIKNFEYILSNWDKVEEFLRRQTDITQINRNINNIRNQIKNGASKSNFQAANNSQQTSSQRKEY